MDYSRIVALDVETPNYANNRMSAVGVVLIENGVITERFYSLVNPETSFDAFNIRLTGITPRMVRSSPTFAGLWPRLRSMLELGPIAAHNAPFDLGVLSACLRDYGIAWKSEVPYFCTCRMGRKLLPQLSDHRLNTLAAYYQLPLDHHNAASDTLVCAQLLIKYFEAGMDPDAFCRRFMLTGKAGQS